MINTVSGYGSTGRTCIELAKVIEEHGGECYIAYGQGETSYKKSFKIGTRIENHLHNIGSRVFGTQGYFSKTGTIALINFIKRYKPDIIHLRNLHGNYLHLETLFSFLSEYSGKVVQTLHDCWAFTGKCAHYTEVRCDKWQTECSNCPQVKKYPSSLFFDFSNKMYLDKKIWYNSIKNITIQPVSNWLKNEVAKSFLKDFPIRMVYNWVDHSFFKPTKGLDFIKYNLNSKKFTLLFVSAGWNPNTVKWKDLERLANELSSDYQLIVVGKNKYKELLPKNCVAIDYIDGKEELAKFYTFADVYVHLSIEDTFGKVIAEAMSCGTPAIVYNSTACGEIVGDGCGYVVEPRNIDEILINVKNVENNSKEFYSDRCRSYVVQNFDYLTNANLIIEIYKEM